MAHFARLEENVVRDVIVVNNDVILDETGDEQEALGIAFCRSLYGENTQWLQTSYTGSFRGKFAGLNDVYDPELDAFIEQSIDLATETPAE